MPSGSLRSSRSSSRPVRWTQRARPGCSDPDPELGTEAHPHPQPQPGPVVSMLGPALGGILYGALGSRFPALAPSLVGVVFALIAFAAVRLWLPPRKPPAPPGAEPPAPPGAELALELAAVSVIGARGSGLRKAAAVDDEPHASPGSSRPSEADGDAPPRPGSSRPSLFAVLRTHPLPLVMLVRAGAGGILFGMCALPPRSCAPALLHRCTPLYPSPSRTPRRFDVVPLWLVASRGVGGLALDEKTLGGVLAATSVLMLPWSIGPMGHFIKRCGVRFAMRSGLLCAALAFALAVPATLAADAVRPALGIAVTTLVNSLATMASSTAGVASFAATNNASERFAARTGAINGVHITAEAIGKLLGPALGAPLFGALLGALRPPEGHVAALQLNGPCATFLIFGGASLMCFAGAVALPRSVNSPQRAPLLHGRSTRSDATGGY